MAVKKGGLNMGKGLQNLIPGGKAAVKSEKKENEEKTFLKETAALENKAEVDEKDVQEFKISLVIPNAEHPRKEFDDAALAELSESIQNFGIIQPLIVQKKGKYYEIIAGERRWRAAKLAGLKKVPVIVREYTAQQVMEISLIENIQREDLNPIEEAVAFKKLVDEFQMTQADLAKRVSKSRTAIANSMRLLKLDERVQKMLIDGVLSAGHARTLLAIEDNDLQFDIATQIISNSLSVRETEQLIQKMKTSVKVVESEDTTQIDSIYNSIEERLKAIIGSKVSIKRKKSGRGCIEIEYYSSEEFDRILDMLHKVKEGNN